MFNQEIYKKLLTNDFFRVEEESSPFDDKLYEDLLKATSPVNQADEGQVNDNLANEELQNSPIDQDDAESISQAIFDENEEALPLEDMPIQAEDDNIGQEIASTEVPYDEQNLDFNIALMQGMAVAPEQVKVNESKPKYVVSPTFAQKVLKADEIIQDRYDELKNYALRFKKLKSRISKKFDSVNMGRLHFVKLSVAGKTLKLYLNMNISDTDPKFHCVDVQDRKTYVEVPVLLRVKSGRAMRYAKILIDQCASEHGLKENMKFEEVDAIAMVEEFLYNQ